MAKKEIISQTLSYSHLDTCNLSSEGNILPPLHCEPPLLLEGIPLHICVCACVRVCESVLTLCPLQKFYESFLDKLMCSLTPVQYFSQYFCPNQKSKSYTECFHLPVYAEQSNFVYKMQILSDLL